MKYPSRPTPLDRTKWLRSVVRSCRLGGDFVLMSFMTGNKASSEKKRLIADMNADLFEIGWGRILGARRKSGGMVEVGIVFVDVHCRGVMSAVYRVISEEEFDEQRRGEIQEIGECPEIDPACARKIIEGAVEYARALGFAPNRNLKKAMRVFGGVRASDCSEEFTFGCDGKPHYREDPDDPPEVVARTILRLFRRFGWEGFYYTLSTENMEAVGDLFFNLDLPLPADETDDSFESDPKTNDAFPEERPMAAMASFASEFPELAANETRGVRLQKPQSGLPAGDYGFIELYCVDPECDCRRVLIQVRSSERPETVLATINYGWEDEAFYTRWLGGNSNDAHDMAGATLDPLNPQSEYAGALLRLFEAVVLQDAAYVERLKKHYLLFRSKIRKREARTGGSGTASGSLQQSSAKEASLRLPPSGEDRSSRS